VALHAAAPFGFDSMIREAFETIQVLKPTCAIPAFISKGSASPNTVALPVSSGQTASSFRTFALTVSYDPLPSLKGRCLFCILAGPSKLTTRVKRSEEHTSEL